MGFMEKTYAKILWRYLKNKCGYTDNEMAKLKEMKWLKKYEDRSLSFYWLVVEMVKTNRCTVGFKQGQKIYFDNTGMLIKRKSPNRICPHAIAALSPVIYIVLDRIGRGADPAKMQVDHVCCTDPGFDHGGLGNNLMKISFERMPFLSYLRNMMDMQWNILFRAKGARGPNPGGIA